MTPARFRWGLFLILFGVLVMLWNLGLLNSNWFWYLIDWSPVLLIAIGIEKIFTRSKFELISYATSVGLFVGGLAIACYSSSGGMASSYAEDTTYIKEFADNVREIDAVLELDDGAMMIRDATEDLVYAKFPRFTTKPDVEYEVVGEKARLRFERAPFRLLGGAIRVDDVGPDDWAIKFNEDLPLTLECRGDGADMHLSMATTPLRKLILEAADSRVYVKIGDMQPDVFVSLFGDDADVQLRVPRDAALKVHGAGYEAMLEQIGLIPANGLYMSKKFEDGYPKIEVDLDDRLRSLSIDTY